MTLEQFKIKTLGNTYGNPVTNTWVGECVSYVRQYMEQVLDIKTAVWGHALNYWTNPSVLQYFTKVQTPQDGDIVVWGDDVGSWTSSVGHIAIWYKGKILNQNYRGLKKVTLNNIFTPGLLGYLRPKSSIIDTMPNEQDVKDYFKVWVGKAPTINELRDYSSKSWRYLTDKMLQYSTDKLKVQLAAKPRTVDNPANVQRIGELEIHNSLLDTDNNALRQLGTAQSQIIGDLEIDNNTLRDKLASYIEAVASVPKPTTLWGLIKALFHIK